MLTALIIAWKTVTGSNVKLILYADDTSFIVANPSHMVFINNVNETLMAVTTWFNNNQLSLNLNKSTYLQFCAKNRQKLDFNISSSKVQISQKTNIKFLSLLIDETLSWKSHITHQNDLDLHAMHLEL
jgi:hypothetical protein